MPSLKPCCRQCHGPEADRQPPTVQVAVAKTTMTPRDSSKVIGRLKAPDRVSGSAGLWLTAGSLQTVPSQLQTLVAQEALSQTEASSVTTMEFLRIAS